MFETEKTIDFQALQNAPILFWRMDLLKQSFTNLNHFAKGGLERENYRFFKDRNYRNALILPQDIATVDSALAEIRQRLPVSIIFRIQAGQKMHWFKLTGWPVGDHRFYEGAVEEISEHIGRLQGIFAGRNRRLYSVELDDYPVAIFRKRDKHLLKFNAPFSTLAQISSQSKKKFSLDQLVTTEINLPLLEERLLLEGRLEETLHLTHPGDERIQALCLLERFEFQGNELIRLSVVEVLGTTGRTGPRPSEIDALCRQFEGAHAIQGMLDAIFANRDLLPGLDAVMYSDIHSKKKSVFVHASGPLFEALEPGRKYPYSGTIAENIERENLEYLIVDDTHASIKAIDWALFVPHGVQSYIAKALYVRGTMRTVLIFCSGRKQAFSDRQVGEVTRIAVAFHRRLRQIRSGK